MTQKKYFVYGAEKIRLQNKNIWTLFMKIKKTEMFKNTLKNKWNHYNKLIQNIDLLKYGCSTKKGAAKNEGAEKLRVLKKIMVIKK